MGTSSACYFSISTISSGSTIEHGHLVGSKLLGQVGQALRENLRLVDAAFRYGGDEFAILLPQTSKDAALLVARRLMAVFHSNRLAPWMRLLTYRCGPVLELQAYPVDATTPQAIVQRADEMMYQVKQGGRDNIAVAGAGIVGGGGRTQSRYTDLLQPELQCCDTGNAY